MKIEDAPPPGWYPDPERGGRLRWWEGADWTDQRRLLPTANEAQAAEARAREVAETASSFPPPGTLRLDPQDTDQIVSRVRDAAREEVTRASTMLSRQATTSFERARAVAAEYADRVFRWVRIVVVTVAVLVIAWFVLQFVAQVALFEWIGDRVDNVTG